MAINMYKKLGYTVYRQVLGYYSGEEDAYGNQRETDTERERERETYTYRHRSTLVLIVMMMMMDERVLQPANRTLVSTFKTGHTDLEATETERWG